MPPAVLSLRINDAHIEDEDAHKDCCCKQAHYHSDNHSYGIIKQNNHDSNASMIYIIAYINAMTWMRSIASCMVLLVLLMAVFGASQWDRIGWTMHAWKATATRKPVPHILHQTWKTSALTPKQRQLRQSWQQHYPEWEHVLWTDDMIEAYVRDRWSWYLPVWRQLTPFIKKVDTVRYMWMYDIGGMYADLDMKCLAPLQVTEGAYIPVGLRSVGWTHDQDEASPAFLASDPGNPVWLHMLRYIALNGNRTVLKATGPVALANVLLGLKDKSNLDITLLSETAMGIGRFKFLGRYVYHENHNTWTDGSTVEGAWMQQPQVLARLEGLLGESR